MSKRLKLIFVSSLFALLFLYACVNTYFFVAGNLSPSFAGWYATHDGRVRTTHFGQNNPASALQDGDKIETVNGQPFANSSQYLKTFDGPPGGYYSIAVLRDGHRYEFELQTTTTPRVLLVLKILTQARLLTFVWLITGLTIFLLQSENKQALLLALMLGMMAVGGDPAAKLMLAALPLWLLALMVPAQIAGALSPVVIFHFLLVFPDRSVLLRRFPRLEYLIYLLWVPIVGPVALVNAYVWITAPDRFLNERLPILASMANALLFLYVMTGLVFLVVSYRQMNLSARRKIRVAMTGIIVGLTPFMFFKIIDFHWGNPAINYGLTSGYIAAILMLILPPLSFAYAIARHQVIPVSLIVRRSIQYLLARNALRLLLALPFLGIALTIAADRQQPVVDVLFRNSVYFYLLLIAAIAVSLVFRKRLTEWIDRKFFRESYNEERILRELVDEVKKSDSMAEISRLVCRKVEAALHPQNLYLFYGEKEQRDLSLGYSSEGPAEGLKIPEEFELLRLMESTDAAQDFPLPTKTRLPQSEIEWLRLLGTKLIVPMTGSDGRLAGLLLLAGKRSEIPYTARDRELLETLADEIAILYENVQLKQCVERDRRIRHEVLTRISGKEFNLLKECSRCGACYDYAQEICARDRIPLSLSLPIERTIENRYRLEQLIGRGGMGAVYEATDLRLNRRVAAKILKGSMFGDAGALRRFAREAQACARLNHPNIITVHDYGLLSTEGAFLVMELVQGETLRARLRREKSLQPSMAAKIFDQSLEGLKAAHAAGVVHRDLKPENILITTSADGPEQVRILDFGLAKLAQITTLDSQGQTSPGRLTTPGTAVGTFGYMSPEQLLDELIDERSDFFSFGVMVVESLTGQRPFTGATYNEALMNLLNGVYHLPGDSPATQHLDRVLQRCLAKDRAARFSSAEELQSELIPALGDSPAFAALAEPQCDASTAILQH